MQKENVPTLERMFELQEQSNSLHGCRKNTPCLNGKFQEKNLYITEQEITSIRKNYWQSFSALIWKKRKRKEDNCYKK